MSALVSLLSVLAASQIQMGSLALELTDAAGNPVSEASIVLAHVESDWERRVRLEAGDGQARFSNVPFGLYRLLVEAPGLETTESQLRIDSNLMVEKVLTLEPAIRLVDATEVREAPPLLDARQVSHIRRIDESLSDRLPKTASAALQNTVATAAGWATEDNGLMHARGVDDGFLYVHDGVPVSDRVDATFSNAMDLDAFESIEILDGHLAAEYGNTSAGVIQVVAKSGLDRDTEAGVTAGYGSEQTNNASASIGSRLNGDTGLFATLSHRGSSERFLDPVDPDNLNNSGNALRFNGRFDWRLDAENLLVANLAASGSDFRVTNSLEQEEAGQRQTQELRDNHMTLLWQRIAGDSTLSELSFYRRAFQAKLLPSENDTPLSAFQDRQHERLGARLQLTHQAGEHLWKFGGSVERVSPNERFEFFVADEDEGEEAGLSDAALAFDEDDPFSFAGEETFDQVSVFVQDSVSFADRVTLNAGLRFDSAAVLQRESQLSPRVGVVFALQQWDALIRGSFNRLFKPPQIENLLLSASPEARVLSPFAEESIGGGDSVFSERQSAMELGFSKDFNGRARFDVTLWHRRFENQADPNVFFGTTIVFPNSVAEGRARGLDLRLVVPVQRGVSGFINYSNGLVYQRGPINGGLFLEEEVIEIGPGTRFTPDHDQRHVASFGVGYEHRASGFWIQLLGRHESGTPLEVEEDELDELMDRRGAELVDFERGRVKPRTLWDISLGIPLKRDGAVRAEILALVRNLTGARFAYNFSNPFSGTHFGHPRTASVQLKLAFGAR